MFTENKNNWGTIVIGAGQAGLATGYYLKNSGEDFIIVDAGAKIGDSWRNRWDSLKLFTPNWANALPGYPFTGNKNLHAGKDEVADFLESYAKKFDIPVLTNTKVIALEKKDGIYTVSTSRGILTCKNIVIANGSYASPKIPSFAKKLDPNIVQIHSSVYKRASNLPVGNVLVVGAGTSGIQIAIDAVSPLRKIFVAGNPPFKIPGFILKYFDKQFVWAMNHIMTIKTKPGRKAAYAIKNKHAAAPLINTSIQDAKNAGVKHVSRIKDVVDGYPLLEDGTVLKVSTIIWCTGYACDFSWINMDDITDESGYPLAYRGVSGKHKGLYFTGMMFQYALTSTWINGAGRDAKYIAGFIHSN
jgi:putative flavoprotein involved in K+ transport